MMTGRPRRAERAEGRGLAWTQERRRSDEGRRPPEAAPSQAGDTVMSRAMTWRGVIGEFAPSLPGVPADAIVTLGEGGTPLLPAPALSELTGCSVHLKIEGMNPTGSFKDRGMTVAVSLAKALGARTVICASTGNTSASAAAYAARAGLNCVVLVPRGKIALGKLAQAIVYGARLLQVDGNFDDCLELVRKLAASSDVAVVNSVNPDRLEGQKTAAFEVIQALGDAPDVHCLPVGNAGNISAYWLGYREYLACGRSTHAPRMLGFQAAGAAPLVRGEPVANPETVASAIRIGSPASWRLAEEARHESGGMFGAVTDSEILAAYRLLARREGVFGEPASAAGVAGLLKACEDGTVHPGSVVVCTITGTGLKDPDAALAGLPEPAVVGVDAKAAAAALGL
jgi:threonine synthase